MAKAKTAKGGKVPWKNKKEREEYIVRFVLKMCSNAERETLAARQSWEENHQLFQGNQDFGKEREDNPAMSKVFMHEFAPIIRRAANAAQNIIFENKDFISVTGPGGIQDYDIFTKIQEKIIRHYIKQMKFENKFYEFCLAGGIYGMATWKITITRESKFTPEIVIAEIEDANKDEIGDSDTPRNFDLSSDEAVQAGVEEAIASILGAQAEITAFPTVVGKKISELKLDLQYINPLLHYYEPGIEDPNESMWRADRIYKKFYQIEGNFNSGIFEKDKRQALMDMGDYRGGSKSGTSTSSLEGYRWQIGNLQTLPNQHTPNVELLDYTGPLLGENGEILEEARHFIIGNQSVLLRDKPNRYFHRKPPYLTTVFNKVPGKASGAGIADGAKDKQVLINDLYSLLVDMIRKDVHGALAVQLDKIVDHSQLDGGIKPGQVIATFGAKPQDVFSQIPLNSNVTPQVHQVIEKLSLGAQKSSGVGTQTSNPSSRARITATETSFNQQQTEESVRVLAHALDVDCIEPLAHLTKDLALQYGFDKAALDELHIQGVLTKDEYMMISNISMIERFNEVKRRVQISVKGFRHSLERDKFLARTAEFIRTVSFIPSAVEQFEWNNVIRDITEAYGFDSDKWLPRNTPQDKAREEGKLLANNQQVGISPNDEDAAELLIHYQQLIEGANDAIASHIIMHIESASQKGAQIPPPPPEAAQLLGIGGPQQEQPQQQEGAFQGLPQ